MRAAENRRWIVRATNNGITAVIDPAGAIREQLPSFDARSARVAFGFVNSVTLFSAAGDWFPLLGAVLVVVALIATQQPHYTKPRKPTAAPQSKSKSPQ
jgi:apolipoprotein N-acyltransferase